VGRPARADSWRRILRLPDARCACWARRGSDLCGADRIAAASPWRWQWENGSFGRIWTFGCLATKASWHCADPIIGLDDLRLPFAEAIWRLNLLRDAWIRFWPVSEQIAARRPSVVGRGLCERFRRLSPPRQKKQKKINGRWMRAAADSVRRRFRGGSRPRVGLAPSSRVY